MASRQPRPFTPEQRAAGVRKAAELRHARTSALRSDFHPNDEEEWRVLAANHGVTLPQYGTACTTAAMERWLRRLGIPLNAYLDHMGAGMDGNDHSHRLSDFPTRNPTWPLKAWLGLVLEAIDTGHLRQEKETSHP